MEYAMARTTAKAVAAKPAAKRSTAAAKTPAAKAAAAKPAARKTASKPAAKPAAKPVAKPATKPAKTAKTAKQAAARIAKPARSQAANKDTRVESGPLRPKLVRDSFTMPEQEYAVLGAVKQACLKAGFEVKKSELLRIGVALLGQLDTAALRAVLGSLPQLKTGRPPGD
jgi:hypothetical protein